MSNNYKFHSTGQFRNVIKNIQTSAQYKGQDDEGNAIIDSTATAPTLKYTGTVKLHGTNGSWVLDEYGLSFHSKNNLLGYYNTDGFVLNSDNSEFAQSMSRRVESVKVVLARIKALFGTGYNTIKVSGEWCGAGIQKGVGISFLPKKSFFIFGVKLDDDWVPVRLLEGIADGCEDVGIYSIMDFPSFEVDINFNNPQDIQNHLIECTELVEELCPVSHYLKTKDADGVAQTLGEGIVWTPYDYSYSKDSGNWFKTKGEKHSISKVKTLAPIDTEKMNSIQEFVEYAVTENRLAQGVQEVGGVDNKLIGAFLSWISKDINKEEGDVLEDNNLTMKDVGKGVSTKARTWYMNQL
tara:strand:+ start:1852 stop:2907 length:1056 start_codon:yes stop_codon:yes gene_type:complete